MKGSRLLAWIALLSLAIAGCSGVSQSSSAGGGTAPFSITIKDNPPTNVTLLSFAVTITGAVLHSSAGKPDVSLISSPIKIEVEQLQVESAFLSTVNIPADTYKDIAISFANPEITFKNDTGGTLLGCAVGQVCELKPAVAGSATFSSPPFPLTITANTPSGLLVDVNLNNIISNTLGVDFNAIGSFTVTQLPLPGGLTGELEELQDLTGVVANKDAVNNQFTLQTTHGNFLVQANSSTEFDDFASCAANNFTCVQNGQVVEADLALMGAGSFLAKKIELEDTIVDDELEGIVFSVTSSTQFKIVVVDELREVAGVAIGNPITVNLATSTSFQVDTNGLTIPAGLLSAFQGATDTSELLPGQRVEVRVRSLAAGPPITVFTDRVILRGSRITATVASVIPPNFTLNPLPSLFTSAGITQIQVQTSLQTEFENVANVASLATGDFVSVQGPLFKTFTDPILVAEKVLKR